MQKIPFYKVSPSGNMTILLDNKGLIPSQKLSLANYALNDQHLGGEQLGFIDIENGILEMSGGEFCANATRSLALVMALNSGYTGDNNETWQGTLQCSGYSQELGVLVKKQGDSHNVSLYMPIDNTIEIKELSLGFYLVSLPGIKHLLIDAEKYPFPNGDWRDTVRKLEQIFNLEELPAIGYIWWKLFEEDKSEQEIVAEHICHMEMHPIIRVLEPLTECYEHACGSGTLALALYLQKTLQRNNFSMHQPGGALNISFSMEDDKIAILSGKVCLIAQGELFYKDKV